MRIAFVSAEFPPTPGGVGDYTAQLASGLAERGHAVLVVTGVPDAVAPDLQRAVRVERLPIQWNWRSLPAVLGTLRHWQPEVVHLQYQAGAYQQHAAITLLPRLVRWRLKRPTVVTAHDLRLPYLFPKADPVRRWVLRRLLGDAAAVVITNSEDLGRLQGTIAADREHAGAQAVTGHVIPIGSNIPVAPPPGYSPASWRKAQGLKDGAVIGYFGLLNRSKGVADLVAALPLLDCDVQLLVIGGGATTPEDLRYATELRAQIEQLKLSDRIHWTGACAPTEVSAHLLASDVVVLPFHDGVSYRRGSLLAALAHGCAVVTTVPTGPLDPPLLDGVAARLIPQPSPVAIATAVQGLLTDPEARAGLSRGAQALAERFGWPAIAAAHEVVYNGLIDH